MNLLDGSSAYQAGVAVERDRLRVFIESRLQALEGSPLSRQRQVELQLVLQWLNMPVE